MPNPGSESPDNNAIRDLRDEVKGLNKSTKWNNLIMIVLTLILVAFALIQIVDREVFDDYVERKTFEECFDYYASLSPETGIDSTTIKTCRDKAESLEVN